LLIPSSLSHVDDETMKSIEREREMTGVLINVVSMVGAFGDMYRREKRERETVSVESLIRE